MVNDTSDNGGSRLEVIVEFNGYDKQLQRPRQQDNQVPFLLKCVILSEPHLEGTQKLYRTERMVNVWGSLLSMKSACQTAIRGRQTASTLETPLPAQCILGPHSSRRLMTMS
ncbi:hypothetical protein Pst134EB_002021 [Puccinia striiformis f. sp. tritici]|uniref:Uncharacterized protein n=1 Tax=Puccinia striiformis f. sp. tritici PST-78 TaxID=1165861 RepID=A0A0L0VFY6_9BASI|nr:hypothetical protein Pst134EB_002021 [Puccinia striiformis f. sp. tritici]KNE98168.1 hypothetical protein PSTG_08632 [Puccinia striiformis f. sp. tritici PST-78]